MSDGDDPFGDMELARRGVKSARAIIEKTPFEPIALLAADGQYICFRGTGVERCGEGLLAAIRMANESEH